MIEITIKISTDAKGGIVCDSQCFGIGSTDEARCALAVFESSQIGYEEYCKMRGIKPNISNIQGSVTEVGQG